MPTNCGNYENTRDILSHTAGDGLPTTVYGFLACAFLHTFTYKYCIWYTYIIVYCTYLCIQCHLLGGIPPVQLWLEMPLTSTKVYKVSLDGQLVVVESSWRSQNTSYPDILHTRWTLFCRIKGISVQCSYCYIQVTKWLYICTMLLEEIIKRHKHSSCWRCHFFRSFFYCFLSYYKILLFRIWPTSALFIQEKNLINSHFQQRPIKECKRRTLARNTTIKMWLCPFWDLQSPYTLVDIGEGQLQ